MDTHQRIHAVVRRIPRGRVATYGQVARLAGLPRQARLVGYALHHAPDGLPWHRVINARGEVSLREPGSRGAERLQRMLLEDEGVTFDRKNRVDLKRFQWKPRVGGKRAYRGRGSSMSATT